MTFGEIIEELRGRLPNSNYLDIMWSTIEGTNLESFISLEDEAVYKSHIPVDFSNYLKTCLTKLREANQDSNNCIAMLKTVNVKYVATLIHFAVEQAYVPVQNSSLYAADMFFLLNQLDIPNTNFFFNLTYTKILDMLKKVLLAPDLYNAALLETMSDFTNFLNKRTLSDDAVLESVMILAQFTFCGTERFECINAGVSFENVSYMAFVGLSHLISKLCQQTPKEKNLLPILLALTASLNSTACNDYPPNSVAVHQDNVRVFLRENINHFIAQKCCTIVVALRCLCISPDYDYYEGIARIIQDLPQQYYGHFQTFYVGSLLSDGEDDQICLLNYAVYLIRHLSPYETSEQHSSRVHTIIYAMITLLMKSKSVLGEIIVEVLSKCSEEPLAMDIINGIILTPAVHINSESIMQALYDRTDNSWNKTSLNVSYITLTCRIFLDCIDVLEINVLNQLRSVCICGSPSDLKPCIGLFKRILTKHSTKTVAVLYFMDMFIKLALHPQEDSNTFAKDLYDFIFSNITINLQDSFVWYLLGGMCSSCIDTMALFEKFHSLKLLKPHPLKLLLDLNLINTQCRRCALEVVWHMLHFLKYSDTKNLDKTLEYWQRQCCPDIVEFPLVLRCLIMMLEQKDPKKCTAYEIKTYRHLHLVVYQSLYGQLFSNDCVKYARDLLKQYTRLLAEGAQWGQDIFLRTEDSLHNKLMLINEMKPINLVYLLKDVSYVIDFVILGREILGEYSFKELEKIIKLANNNPQFITHMNSNQGIFLMCILLYTNMCLVNATLIPKCVKSLNNITKLTNTDKSLKLQIMMSLYDVCKLHLNYFQPLVSFTMDMILSDDALLRFNAMHIIMALIDNQQIRLVGGHYFIFMGLLADNNQLVVHHLIMFLEKFLPLHHQTILLYFVPGIIHYNHYLKHPAITLTQSEQVFIKQRIYSLQNRHDIYYYLYKPLPDAIKFNILKEITVDILDKISDGSMAITAKVSSILEDALLVMMFTIHKNPQHDSLNRFYEDSISNFKSKLLLGYSTTPRENFKEHQFTLNILLKSLFGLLYGQLLEHENLSNNVLFTIITLTNDFFDLVKYMITEDGSLKKCFAKLESYWKSKWEFLQTCDVSVNPADFVPHLPERDKLPFYFLEFKQFSFISDDLINTFNK